MMPTRISLGGGVGVDCALVGRAVAMRSVRDAARRGVAFMCLDSSVFYSSACVA